MVYGLFRDKEGGLVGPTADTGHTNAHHRRSLGRGGQNLIDTPASSSRGEPENPRRREGLLLRLPLYQHRLDVRVTNGRRKGQLG
jgi:hypothetical protein